jgi:hypothetical protein
MTIEREAFNCLGTWRHALTSRNNFVHFFCRTIRSKQGDFTRKKVAQVSEVGKKEKEDRIIYYKAN